MNTQGRTNHSVDYTTPTPFSLVGKSKFKPIRFGQVNRKTSLDNGFSNKNGKKVDEPEISGDKNANVNGRVKSFPLLKTQEKNENIKEETLNIILKDENNKTTDILPKEQEKEGVEKDQTLAKVLNNVETSEKSETLDLIQNVEDGHGKDGEAPSKILNVENENENKNEMTGSLPKDEQGNGKERFLDQIQTNVGEIPKNEPANSEVEFPGLIQNEEESIENGKIQESIPKHEIESNALGGSTDMVAKNEQWDKEKEFLTETCSRGSSETSCPYSSMSGVYEVEEEERPYTDDDIDDIETIYKAPQRHHVVKSTMSNETLFLDGLVESSSEVFETNENNRCIDNVAEGSLKPTDDDFILPPLPPPPSDAFLNAQQPRTNYSKVTFNPAQKVRSPTSPTSKGDFPPPPTDLPPPPSDLLGAPKTPPPHEQPKLTTAKPFTTNATAKGFRSVSFPVSKSPTPPTRPVLPYQNPPFKKSTETNTKTLESENTEKTTMFNTAKTTFGNTAESTPGNTEKTTGNTSTHPVNGQPMIRTPTPPNGGYVTLLRDTRQILIKPTNSNGGKVENSTKVTIHGTPFPTPPGASVEVTPQHNLPGGAVYQTTTKEGDLYHTDTYYPASNPGDPQAVVLERTKTTTLVKAPHHEGIGPTTGTGVPVALKSSVDDSKHWYKSMFKQMHKIDGNEADTPETNGLSPRPMSADSSNGRHHVSMETERPTRVGKITDYKPAEPYVVENKPQMETTVPTSSTSYTPPHSKMSGYHSNVTKQPITTQHKKESTTDAVKRNVNQQQRKSQGDGIRQPAKAKFDFNSRTGKELSVKRGQTVIITRRVDDNWYMTETPDGVKSGIIPVEYLKVITSASQPDKPTRHGQAKAKFDFNGKTKNELSFKKGDDLVLLKRVDDNWYKGKLGPNTGILPVGYVQVTLEPETKQTKKETIPKQLEVSPRSSHSQQSSTISQTSLDSSEPDETEKKNRAAFLAHSVVGHTPALASNHRHRGKFDLTELDQVIDQSTATVAQPKPTNIEVHYDYPKPVKPQSPKPPPTQQTLPLPTVPSYPSSTSSQPSSPRAISPPAPDIDYGQIIGRYVALYAYESSNEDELDLRPGDVVIVVEICDDGWYVGTSERTGGFGTFPGNYVTAAQ